MRRHATVLLVSGALGACFSGGSSSPALDAASGPDATPPCMGTLAEHCSDCPASEQAARDLLSGYCSEVGSSSILTAGHCGDFRYVQFWGGFSSAVYYYDGQDELVGAFFGTDTPEYCEGTSFQIAVGTVPDCERQDEVDLRSAP